MADAFDALTFVKNSLGITGEFHDVTLQSYIDEVKAYLADAGVTESVVHSSTCAGAIARGVADLWNLGAGGAELSPYFHERAAQLALKWGAGNEQT